MKTIEIDDDIDALDMAIQDKIALATMRQRPRIGNPALAKLLGVSDSGVRTVIRRFKATRLVKELKFAGTREFKLLVGDQGAEGSARQKVTKTGTSEIRQKMTDEPPQGLTAEERANWKLGYFLKELRSVEEISLRFDTLRMAGYHFGKYDELARKIAADPDLPQADRQELVAVAARMRNIYAVANYVGDHIPEKQKPAALTAVKGATQEQLAMFYERIQSGQLGAGNSHLLIDIGLG